MDQRSRPHGCDSPVTSTPTLEPRRAVFRQDRLGKELVGVTDPGVLGFDFGDHGLVVFALQFLDALDDVVALEFDHGNHGRVGSSIGPEVEEEIGHADGADGEVGFWFRVPDLV
jgi:hypothetical protein